MKFWEEFVEDLRNKLHNDMKKFAETGNCKLNPDSNCTICPFYDECEDDPYYCENKGDILRRLNSEVEEK